jgi:hypothetical protein
MAASQKVLTVSKLNLSSAEIPTSRRLPLAVCRPVGQAPRQYSAHAPAVLTYSAVGVPPGPPVRFPRGRLLVPRIQCAGSNPRDLERVRHVADQRADIEEAHLQRRHLAFGSELVSTQRRSGTWLVLGLGLELS